MPLLPGSLATCLPNVTRRGTIASAMARLALALAFVCSSRGQDRSSRPKLSKTRLGRRTVERLPLLSASLLLVGLRLPPPGYTAIQRSTLFVSFKKLS